MFYLFYYNAIFKDRVLFKDTRSSIEMTSLKTPFFTQHLWWLLLKKVNVIVTVIIEYA